MIKYKKGDIAKGVVSGIESYGIFVKLEQNYTGLIHISEISNGFVKNICDYATVGDVIYAEVIELNAESQHAKLSIKNIQHKNGAVLQRRKIVETANGFATLEQYLPLWIEQNIKKYKNRINSIDK